MSTITALSSTDTGATSLTTINTNFTNLNTDKYQSGNSPIFNSTVITTSGFGYLSLGQRTDATTASAILAFDSSTASGVWSIQNSAGNLTFNTGGTVGSSLGSEFLRFSLAGSSVFGPQQALATNATDGFVYIPTSAGAPTGVPTAYTGKVAMQFDTTNNKLWIYDGAWIGVVLS